MVNSNKYTNVKHCRLLIRSQSKNDKQRENEEDDGTRRTESTTEKETKKKKIPFNTKAHKNKRMEFSRTSKID